MSEATCPVCGRLIIIERGFWTRHTDPSTWSRRVRQLKQCRMAAQRYQPRTENLQ